MIHIEKGSSFKLPLPDTKGLSIEFQWIDADSFTMGCPEESVNFIPTVTNQILVKFSTGFWIGRYPVTVAQWNSLFPVKTDDATINLHKPKTNVSWFESMEFCHSINRIYATSLPENMQFRLPTEAEWEYCLRGNSPSNDGYKMDYLDSIAWYAGNSNGLQDVGKKAPTKWNLYDLQGNVMEWCFDSAGYTRVNTEPVDYMSFYNVSTRHVRSGAFGHEANSFLFSDCSGDDYPKDTKLYWLGFRVCLGIAAENKEDI